MVIALHAEYETHGVADRFKKENHEQASDTRVAAGLRYSDSEGGAGSCVDSKQDSGVNKLENHDADEPSCDRELFALLAVGSEVGCD